MRGGCSAVLSFRFVLLWVMALRGVWGQLFPKAPLKIPDTHGSPWGGMMGGSPEKSSSNGNNNGPSLKLPADWADSLKALTHAGSVLSEAQKNVVQQALLVERLKEKLTGAQGPATKTDDEVTYAAATQFVTGFLLVFARHLPTSVETTLELFALFENYARLGGNVAGVETRLVRGEARESRLQKRAAAITMFVLSAASASSAIGPLSLSAKTVAKLCVGVAAARTATSLADFAATQRARERAEAQATHALLEGDTENPFLTAAKQALKLAVKDEHDAVEFEQVEAPPLQRAATAAAFTAVALVSSALDNYLSKNTSADNSAGSSNLVALSAAVVGAFQVGKASRTLYESLLAKTPALKSAGAILNGVWKMTLKPVVSAAFSAVKVVADKSMNAGAGPLLGLVGKLVKSIIRGILGERVVSFFSDLRLPPFAKGAVDVLNNAATSLATDGFALYKTTRTHLIRFLKANHDTLWPWLVAVAGFKCKIGELSFFPGVPRYLAKSVALPTFALLRIGLNLLGAALRGARGVLGRPPASSSV